MSCVEDLVPGPVNQVIHLTNYQSQYYGGLEQSEKDKYYEKLIKCDIDCPFTIPDALWITDASQFEKFTPRISETEMHMLLISQRSECTGLPQNAIKSIITAKEAVDRGWLNKLAACPQSNGNVIFKGDVKHSMSFSSKKDLTPWVAIHKDLMIMGAHCNCIAGLSGVCSHVGILLYGILTELETPCTSRENSWISSRKTVPIDLKKHIADFNSANKKRSEESKKKEKEKLDAIPKMTPSEKTALLDAVALNRGVHLYGVFPYALQLVPALLPTRLATIFRKALVDKPLEEIRAVAEDVFEEIMSCEIQQSVEVERLTRNQRKSPMWGQMRVGRCTASVAHLICHTTNFDDPSKSLIKRICFPAKRYTNAPSLRYGIDNESKCIRRGCSFLRKAGLHKGFRVSKSGFLIPIKQPWMGASSDGFIECDCCGRGIIEAKCSYSHRHAASLTSVALSDANFCLSYNVELKEFQLKQTHPYYYQMQQQMVCSETSFGLLMVFVEDDIAVVNVNRDPVICDEIIAKTKCYSLKVLLPQLLSDCFVSANYRPTIAHPVTILEDDEFEDIPDITASSIPLDLDEDLPGPSYVNNSPTHLNEMNQSSPFDVIVEHRESSIDFDQASGHATTQPDATVSSNPFVAMPVNRSQYRCCLQDNISSPFVTCANVDCLIGTYHRTCAQPQMQQYRRNWKCLACRQTAKKQQSIEKKRDKENQSTNTAAKPLNNNNKRNPLTSVSTNN